MNAAFTQSTSFTVTSIQQELPYTELYVRVKKRLMAG